MWSIVHTISIASILINFTAASEPSVRVETKYALLGNTVHLSLLEHSKNSSLFKWRKGKTVIAQSKLQHPLFHKKFFMNDTDGSLTIQNVTLNDSDNYMVLTGDWDQEHLQYHLIVERMVSMPVIETNRNQTIVNSTYDCQISVKCSVDDESVIYDCNSQICTPSNTPKTRVNITVAVTDSGNVDCTASNNVSTAKGSTALSNTCSEKHRQEEEKTGFFLILVILISCGLGGMIVVYLLVFLISKKKQQKDSHPETEISTVYSVVNKPQISTDNQAANDTASTVYDVPLKRAMPLQTASVQMTKETNGENLGGQPVTASAGTEEESENDNQLTVYWKLGQK